MTDYSPSLGLTLPDFNANAWHDPVNNNFLIIDAAIKSATGIISKGIWLNSTAYEIDDKVIEPASSTVWRANMPHTSAAVPTTFAQDRAANPLYWSLVDTSISFRGAWAATTQYFVGDHIYDSTEHVAAICTVEHLSTGLRADIAANKWALIVDLMPTVLEVIGYRDAAAGSASTASTQAGIATAQAAISTTQAGNSSTSAAASAASANDSLLSANASQVARSGSEAARDTTESLLDAALSAFENFDESYLGAFPTDPTTGPGGIPLANGMLYFSTTENVMKFYDEADAVWRIAYVSGEGQLLAVNNLSDLTDPAAARINLGVFSQADFATFATKGTIVNGDYLLISDSADSGAPKRFTWANAVTQMRALFDDTWHGVRGGGTRHAAVTTSVAGFMSAADKVKLDAFVTAGNYVQKNGGSNFFLHANFGLQGLYFYADPPGSAYNIWSSFDKTYAVTATGNAFAVRDASADLAVRLIRSNYVDETVMRSSFVMRQEASSDNYHRHVLWPNVAAFLAVNGGVASKIEERGSAYANYAISQILPTIAAMLAGGTGQVGSYLFVRRTGGGMNEGDARAGSEIAYSGSNGGGSLNPSGSWRICGRTGAATEATLAGRYN